MNVKTRAAAFALAVLLAVQGGCKVPGYVSNAEYNAQVTQVTSLQSQVTDLQAKLDAANKELADVHQQLDDANAKEDGLRVQLDSAIKEAADLRTKVEKLKPLLCSDHTWKDFENSSFWSVSMYYDSDRFKVIEDDWGVLVEFTQWQPYPSDWDNNKNAYAVIWDQYGALAYDAGGHCLILDPKVWRELTQQ